MMMTSPKIRQTARFQVVSLSQSVGNDSTCSRIRSQGTLERVSGAILLFELRD